MAFIEPKMLNKIKMIITAFILVGVPNPWLIIKCI